MTERSVQVDHATIHRLALILLQLEAAFRKGHRLFVSGSWGIGEIYIRMKGEWRYLHRAVDKLADTIDFMISKKSDKAVVRSFFK